MSTDTQNSKLEMAHEMPFDSISQERVPILVGKAEKATLIYFNKDVLCRSSPHLASIIASGEAKLPLKHAEGEILPESAVQEPISFPDYSLEYFTVWLQWLLPGDKNIVTLCQPFTMSLEDEQTWNTEGPTGERLPLLGLLCNLWMMGKTLQDLRFCSTVLDAVINSAQAGHLFDPDAIADICKGTEPNSTLRQTVLHYFAQQMTDDDSDIFYDYMDHDFSVALYAEIANLSAQEVTVASLNPTPGTCDRHRRPEPCETCKIIDLEWRRKAEERLRARDGMDGDLAGGYVTEDSDV